MAGSTSVTLLRDIETLFDAGTAAGLSDRQLLDRFASHRDAVAEAAFEVLVLRHGPMVLRVCRNVLHDPNDVQDAFQATFLVLVRRCGAVRQIESIGGWLYGVANRVAARARVESARRRALEGRAALRVVEAFEPSHPVEVEREEYGPIVQEEVRRLPEKYRAVVVLCYWEGLTQEQAAVQLGIPLGTVRSRVARARDLLRRRLARRALAPLAVGLATALDGTSATASVPRLSLVPSDLVQATIRAAVQVAGQAVSQMDSVVVASLVQRILWSMTMIKISGMVTAVVLVGLAGYSVRIAAQQAGQPQSVRQVGQVNGNERGRDGQPPPAEPPASKKAGPEKEATADSPADILSQVDGEATIISMRSPAKPVKKGEVLCELDSSRFRDQLPGQIVAAETAKAAYQHARLIREVAEIAVVEYREGIFLQELEGVEGDIKVAEAELALAEDELKAAKDALSQVVVVGSDKSLAVKRAELDIFRAKIALKKAQSQRRLLVDFTRPRTIKALVVEVEKAKGDEDTRRMIWELETQKKIRLERQITNCTIVAPIDGYIRNFNVGEGFKVHVRQMLFQIVPANGGKHSNP